MKPASINMLMLTTYKQYQKATCIKAQAVVFSRKVNKGSHPLTFNKNILYQATSQNHVGIILDNHLSFVERLKLVFSFSCFRVEKS